MHRMTAAVLAAASALAATAAILAATTVTAAGTYEEVVLPFLREHCLECHSGDDAEGDLPLDVYPDAASAVADAAEWDLVHEMVALRKMPPGGQPRPPRAERRALVGWIAAALDLGAKDAPDPGRPVLRRLNHTQYRNTVLALTGVDYAAPQRFPAENVGHGFDNIGASLTLSDALFAQYLDAAATIADLAIIRDADTPTSTQRFDVDRLEGNAHGDAIWLTTRGAARARWQAPRNGRYRVRVEAWGQQAGPDPCRMEVFLGGRRLGAVAVEQERGESGVFAFETEAAAGSHALEAHFVNDYYKPQDPDPGQRDRNLAVVAIEVEGPLDPRPQTSLQRELKQSFPATLDEGRMHAVATYLASLFWRRPPSAAQVDRLLAVVPPEASFDAGVHTLVTALLVSPRFLFRVEAEGAAAGAAEGDATAAAAGTTAGAERNSRALDGWELATRLSYFLWSQPPDATLRALAASGALTDERVLKTQVARMLSDPRAGALARDFAAQWLQLRMLDEVAVDPEIFPTFSPALRRSMMQESLLYFEALLREDRPVQDLLDADFTYLDPLLAGHYGVEGVRGSGMRRVDTGDRPRRGLLGHASILTLTSNPTRTSPVKRGRWVMETLLGTPPPPPPPGAGQLEESQVTGATSLRQQLLQHRERQECAVCHDLMDPLGFGLEGYDATGARREHSNGVPVDDSGVLPDGREFRGPLELAAILNTEESLVETVLERLYVYALGRGLEASDFRILDGILSGFDPGGPRWREVITSIVLSDAFRRRRLRAPG